MDLPEFLLARQCNVGGCDRDDVCARGMCGKHYRHWLDHTPPGERPPAPRFKRRPEANIDKRGPLPPHCPDRGPCWVWTGSTNKQGYGYWCGGGRRGSAHRVSWEIANGPIPGDLWVLHHCDNPPCVNPEHLYLGTVVENARDAVERGRIYRPPVSEVCPDGHRIAGDNLRIVNTPAGPKRFCRTCDNGRARSRAAAKRAAADPGPPSGRLSTAQLMTRLDISKSTFLRWKNAGRFGAPVRYRRQDWWTEDAVRAIEADRLRSA